MSKENINRADLHNSANRHLSSFSTLPNSPTKISFGGYVFNVYFDRLSDTSWNIIKIE